MRSSTIIYTCHTHRHTCSSGLWVTGLCKRHSKVWGGAVGGQHIYQALIFLPHRNWKKLDVGTCWRQEIHTAVYLLMASPSCYYPCHLVKTRNWHLLPGKRARPSVPHLAHCLRPQTRVVLRSSCIYGSAGCVRAFGEPALERWWYCGPGRRNGTGGTGHPAQPSWGKCGQGRSHLLLICRLGWWPVWLSTFRLPLCFVTVDAFIGWIHASLSNFTELTADILICKAGYFYWQCRSTCYVHPIREKSNILSPRS